jgi:molecular chaperone GrpE
MGTDPQIRPEGVGPQDGTPDEAAGVGSADAPAGSGPAQSGPAQPGPAQPGPAQDGPSEPNPVYDEGGPGASAEPGGEDEYDHEAPEGAALAEEDSMAATLLADLQRLQAEYVNYKKRVDRDRELIRTNAVSSVVESLLPVLDDIYLAREAGDLDAGPFAAIAEKLEDILERHGIVRVGKVGDEFDPNVHEAMMHVEAEVPEGATTTTVVQVFQPGYRNGERLVRAARVSVADPA